MLILRACHLWQHTFLSFAKMNFLMITYININSKIMFLLLRIESCTNNSLQNCTRFLFLKGTQKSCIPHTIQNLHDTALPGKILCQNPVSRFQILLNIPHPITSDPHSFKIEIPRNTTESLIYNE